MDSGLYAAYTGLLAKTQALDTAANNLANVGTVGFRAQRDSFRSVYAGDAGNVSQSSQVGDSVNGYGILGGGRSDQGQGPLITTSNPLDVALTGAGFFAIQTAQGVRYTRDGQFSKSPTGQLQTPAGEPVLDAGMKPISLPSGAVDISPDGTISVQTAAGSAVVDQLGTFSFAQPDALVVEGASRFAAPAGQVATASTATVKQGAVEGTNEDAIHGTMQLILVQRQAEMLQKALGAFDTSFDKVAVEQVARV
jgi:flagellar basal-body rod protein FlgF/flagellar basal-body rod protein FlgG